MLIVERPFGAHTEVKLDPWRNGTRYVFWWDVLESDETPKFYADQRDHIVALHIVGLFGVAIC